jgi:hypothetical protein
MKARFIRFGVVELDGKRYERDVVVDRGSVTKRNKGASKPQRQQYGHTPLTLAEGIPWDGRRLIVGTGADGALPIAAEVRQEAHHRGVELVALPTREACRLLSESRARDVVAILHVTC